MQVRLSTKMSWVSAANTKYLRYLSFSYCAGVYSTVQYTHVSLIFIQLLYLTWSVAPVSDENLMYAQLLFHKKGNTMSCDMFFTCPWSLFANPSIVSYHKHIFSCLLLWLFDIVNIMWTNSINLYISSHLTRYRPTVGYNHVSIHRKATSSSS